MTRTKRLSRMFAAIAGVSFMILLAGWLFAPAVNTVPLTGDPTLPGFVDPPDAPLPAETQQTLAMLSAYGTVVGLPSRSSSQPWEPLPRCTTDGVRSSGSRRTLTGRLRKSW